MQICSITETCSLWFNALPKHSSLQLVRCNLNFKALCSVFFLHLFCDCASGIGRVTLGAFLGRFVFFLCSLGHLTGYHFLFSHMSLFSSLGLYSHSPWMRPSPFECAMTLQLLMKRSISAVHLFHPQPDRPQKPQLLS